jgi:putative tryptophan/tyrosine transport system substrate-binding protein
MNRRTILIAMGTSAITIPFAAFAQQQQGKVWRIGFLSSRPGIGPYEEAFLRGLREVGYFEGKNVSVEWRFSKGETKLLSGFAAELVRVKVDCIVANGTNATVAAKQATNTIPIVMANVNDDPVQQDLVASLAHPGGNITGYINISSELAGKRLELLKTALPKASRIAIVFDSDSRAAAAHFAGTETAARTLGVQLQSLGVRNSAGLENAFRTAVKNNAQALIVVSTGLMNSLKEQTLTLAVKSRLPIMFTSSRWVIEGGLMSYGTEESEQYFRAATYVDKILKGASPANLPVVQPTTFEFVINMKAAKQIGLTFPRDVIARADKVIK